VQILLVVNSFASSVTARNTVVVHQELSREHDVQVVETNRRGHATRFAQDAARRDVDVVVAFGGDGTLNEVATGVAGTDTALGVLPGGSTNVFARTLGMPNDPVAAVKMLVEGLGAPQGIAPIGLGRVNGRYFCFHTGIGYDAAVVRTVEKRASMKRWAGHPLFIYAALRTWAIGYDRNEPHFSLTFDTGGDAGGGAGEGDATATSPRDRVDDGYFSVVLNTNPYTFLGNRPLDLSPAATFDRGLVVITFRTMRATAILSSLAGALKGGGVKANAHLDEHVDVDHLVVEHATPFPYQLDGDYLGETTRLEFSHEPDAVRLVHPLAER
jgi:diacylglycerol kinase family enzyme